MEEKIEGDLFGPYNSETNMLMSRNRTLLGSGHPFVSNTWVASFKTVEETATFDGFVMIGLGPNFEIM